jgi:hypothetical protein
MEEIRRKRNARMRKAAGTSDERIDTHVEYVSVFQGRMEEQIMDATSVYSSGCSSGSDALRIEVLRNTTGSSFVDRSLFDRFYRLFVSEKLGKKYIESRAPDFARLFDESTKSMPIFFILSPGVDPLKEVEHHGKKLGYTFQAGKFHNVSLGQGQEIIAENALEISSREGHWIVLQNIHLVRHWLPTLERKLERIFDVSQESFRLFLSAEPSTDSGSHVIPQGLLENSIKITNESNTGRHEQFYS